MLNVDFDAKKYCGPASSTVGENLSRTTIPDYYFIDDFDQGIT
jgi:hypothetical protein